VFDRPLEDPGQLVGRKRELSQLAAALETGREVVVQGPERHGKSSVVSVALAHWAAGEGRLGVLVDCSGVLTAADLAARVDEALVRAVGRGPAENELIERLEALTFNSGAAGGAPPAELDALFALPGEVAERTGSRAVVALDEFQDAATVPGLIEALEAGQRRYRREVSFVFAGLELHSPGKQPDRPAVWGRRPALISVGVIEPELLASHITHRFSETGRDAGEAAGAIAQTGAGHPQRTILLAHQLWELTPPGERATVASTRVAVTQTLTRLGGELNLRWQSLHTNERRVAVAIARDIAPQGTRAQRATGLASISAAQRAVQGIQNAGVAEQRGRQLTLTDPLFAEYLRRRHAPPLAGVDRLASRRAQIQTGGITPRI
jgi:hypothetical protein